MKFNFLFILILLLNLFSCSTSSLKKEISQENQTHLKINSENSILQTKIEKLEQKLAQIEVILNETQSHKNRKIASVEGHPADDAGESIEEHQDLQDPDYGFENDDALQKFKKIQILFKSQKLADSIVKGSAFLREYPDHPLAPSTQWMMAKAYYQQKNLEIALDHLLEILATYPLSHIIPDTLLAILQWTPENKYPKIHGEAQRILISFFNKSPAAVKWSKDQKSKGKS